MVRFSYNGMEYAVSFSYGERSVDKLKQDGILARDHKSKTKDPSSPFLRKTVTARVFRGGRNSDRELMSEGTAVCSPLDAFDAAKGRRFALQRAVLNSRLREKKAKEIVNATNEFAVLARGDKNSAVIDPSSVEKELNRAREKAIGPEMSIILWNAYFQTCSDGVLPDGKRINIMGWSEWCRRHDTSAPRSWSDGTLIRRSSEKITT